jgi:hypothetical protein
VPSMTARNWSNRRRKTGMNGNHRTSARRVRRIAVPSKTGHGRRGPNKKAVPPARLGSPPTCRSRNAWHEP